MMKNTIEDFMVEAASQYGMALKLAKKELYNNLPAKTDPTKISPSIITGAAQLIFVRSIVLYENDKD